MPYIVFEKECAGHCECEADCESCWEATGIIRSSTFAAAFATANPDAILEEWDFIDDEDDECEYVPEDDFEEEGV